MHVDAEMQMQKVKILSLGDKFRNVVLYVIGYGQGGVVWRIRWTQFYEDE